MASRISPAALSAWPASSGRRRLYHLPSNTLPAHGVRRRFLPLVALILQFSARRGSNIQKWSLSMGAIPPSLWAPKLDAVLSLATCIIRPIRRVSAVTSDALVLMELMTVLGVIPPNNIFIFATMAPSSLRVTENGDTMRCATILGISIRGALSHCSLRRCACCRLRFKRLRSVRRFAVLLPTPWISSLCILLPRYYPDGRGYQIPFALLLVGTYTVHLILIGSAMLLLTIFLGGGLSAMSRRMTPYKNDAVDDIITRASDLIKLCVPSGGPDYDVCPAVLHVPHTGIFRILCAPTLAFHVICVQLRFPWLLSWRLIPSSSTLPHQSSPTQ